jgi:hypothetical protein
LTNTWMPHVTCSPWKRTKLAWHPSWLLWLCLHPDSDRELQPSARAITILQNPECLGIQHMKYIWFKLCRWISCSLVTRNWVQYHEISLRQELMQPADDLSHADQFYSLT